ncbi:mitotic checkpoint protein BUB3 [Hibiscus syriacus]|uniref:Mitotic checkpoint protein BUB3 n=1 Tax=Hibiscus syriacus TaxID=106335 RepID=A0A6A2XLJ5_HIBSY|nr:mitotic checkpoint protein BUB3 [Hibiscus syriacus]
MVVCKCRKATKLYCFVHKVPVCGECICFPEHQICVIRTYSEWVIDGEYNWPPKCCKCQAVLQEGDGSETTRLGCLDVIHTNCLISHVKSFPLHTAPAGYTCPSCSTSIWPPKSVKDSASCLHSLLKEAIMQTGMEKNLFGNHPPPAFTSDPLMNINSTGGREHGGNSSPAVSKDEAYSTIGRPSKLMVSEITEIDGPSSAENYMKASSPVGPVATTRKVQFISLIPFWSSALPTLPVTAPPRKDADDGPEGRLKHQRSTRMDPRKILLAMAIMACMATMGILYYRIAQRSLGEGLMDEEPVVLSN